MAYLSYQPLIRDLQALQDYSDLLTEYDCDPVVLSSLRDAVAKQIETVQRQMDRLLASAADPNAPDDYEAITALCEGGNEKRPVDQLLSRIKGALIGRFAGCTLGIPVENWKIEDMQKKAAYEGGDFPPTDYWKTVGEPWRTHYGESWHVRRQILAVTGVRHINVVVSSVVDDDVAVSAGNRNKLLIVSGCGVDIFFRDIQAEVCGG